MNAVRMIGKFNPIFCIPVGNDPDIVSSNTDLKIYEIEFA